MRATTAAVKPGDTLVIETYPLSDVIDAADARRRKAHGFVALEEVGSFIYPTLFTCAVDYAATGEGETAGVVMGRASSADQLKTMVVDHFGEFYAKGADVWPKLHIPKAITNLVPKTVRAMVAEPDLVIGNFYYSSTFHLNQT